MKNLKSRYEVVCDEYVKKFCDKQKINFDYWIGDVVGDIAVFSDLSFNLKDIVWDINSKQPKGHIINWYYDNLEKPTKSINYFSYSKGLRVKDL